MHCLKKKIRAASCIEKKQGQETDSGGYQWPSCQSKLKIILLTKTVGIIFNFFKKIVAGYRDQILLQVILQIVVCATRNILSQPANL